MKLKNKILFTTALVVVFSLIFSACSVIETATNLQKLKFKVSGVNDFRLMNVSLSGKTNITDLSWSDALKLKDLLTMKSFPVSFVLNLDALNPNDGKTSPIKSDATITGMEWRLLIDNVQTISGNINSPISIPSSGQSITIPIQMDLDLYKFFSNKNYDKLIDLALALGGMNNDLTRVKLDIRPTVKTMFGNITYPGWITAVNKTYSN
jgi:LEA14-like dessication related protein